MERKSRQEQRSEYVKGLTHGHSHAHALDPER
jgi:UDP-2,3-diacylglucosamine pyrophosphatase LpxH